MAARPLTLSFVEKPWGRLNWPAPFPDFGGRRIGEAWFAPPAEAHDILIKYIFTTEALSVQVHPSDAQTIAAGLGRQGKEECWLVIDAEPGAEIAIGFKQPVSKDDVAQAIANGSIADLLAWYPATPGAFFYIPANTVHAIGAGIGLIEIQQNSDITYRLYDYGRPRELHLEAGLAIAHCAPHPSACRQLLDFNRATRLCDGPYFQLDYLVHSNFTASLTGPGLIVPLTPGIMAGSRPLGPGDAALIETLGDLQFDVGSACLLVQRPASAR